MKLRRDELLDKLTDFTQKYLPYSDRDLIQAYIRQHEIYGTCDYEVDDKNEVIYVARWNIDGKVVKILDFAVREEYRNKRYIYRVLLKNLKKYLPLYPQVRFVSWLRGSKYPDRKQRVYAIRELLKLKEVQNGMEMVIK